jgi:hypothetical protein
MPTFTSHYLPLYLSAVLLFILPLSFYPFPLSLSLPELILLAALIFFYLKSPPPISKVKISLLLTLLIIAAAILGRYRPLNLSEIIRLVTLAWTFFPLRWLINKYQPRTIVLTILIILSLHACWGLLQFSLQRDLGLSFLGESRLAATFPGVANFTNSSGQKIIRSYGPYAHPNIFAGTLSLGLLMALSFLSNKHLAPTLIIFTALLAAFSRSALLATTFLSFFLRSRRLFSLFILLLLLFLPLWFFRSTDSSDVAYPERLTGFKWSLGLLRENGLWNGVGPGHYPAALSASLNEHQISFAPWQVDYVHSVPLLLLVEWGIIPTFFLLLLLFFHLPSFLSLKHLPFLIFLLPLLALDHYLLTQTTPLLLLITAILLFTCEPSFPQLPLPPYRR